MLKSPVLDLYLSLKHNFFKKPNKNSSERPENPPFFPFFLYQTLSYNPNLERDMGYWMHIEHYV